MKSPRQTWTARPNAVLPYANANSIRPFVAERLHEIREKVEECRREACVFAIRRTRQRRCLKVAKKGSLTRHAYMRINRTQ